MKKNAGKSERFTLRLDPELRSRVKKVALTQDRSEAWVVEKCIVKIIDDLEKAKSPFKAAQLPLIGFAA